MLEKLIKFLKNMPQITILYVIIALLTLTIVTDWYRLNKLEEFVNRLSNAAYYNSLEISDNKSNIEDNDSEISDNESKASNNEDSISSIKLQLNLY
jgi:ABC-type antimicrobial peptide transport system permease subunit